MTSHKLRPLLSLITLSVALFASSAHSQEEASVVVNEYDVFVDLPTAFAFIKLPSGWKFIGKLDADQLRRLPSETKTSLLPPAATQPDSARQASERRTAADEDNG